MRKTIAMVAALAALTACDQFGGGGDEDVAEAETEATEEAEDSEEAAPEPEMLANGAPAYPGMDISAAAVREPNGDSQTVSFESGADIFDIAEFYRTYYEGDDYDITSLSLSASGEENTEGGTVSISRNSQNGGSRVTVMPRDEGGEFDYSKVYGTNIPAYPGVAADAVNEHEFSNGRRSIRFETSDAPIDVFNFYREQLGQNFDLRTASVNAQSRVYRRSASVSASARYNASGSRVSVTTRDPNRQAQAGGSSDSDAAK